MTEHLLVLLICLAVIAVLAILIYVARRGQITALTAVYEIRQTPQHILANTPEDRPLTRRPAPRLLRRPQANFRCDKRGLKTHPVNPIESMAGLADLGV
jgi:Tfp pilus assembly major pilin PilA